MSGLLFLALGITVAPAQSVPGRYAGSGGNVRLACSDEVAAVRGSDNRIAFTGTCPGLVVSGSNNVVDIALRPGGTVRIDGDNNRVAYAGAAAPMAETHGAYDELVPQAAVLGLTPAPPPAMLILDPSSPAFDVSCEGRDVLIRGNGQSYVLRGGCRSVTVQGRQDTITAELLPGAPVSISGPGVVMNYVLIAAGPAPVVRVTSPGLQAKQLQHYGESELSLPTGTFSGRMTTP